MRAALSHREAFELLPWYVNGTLEEPERGAVCAHVASCLVCRRERGFLEQIERGVAESADLDLAAQRSFTSLLGRIDSAEVPLARRVAGRIAAAMDALRAAHPALRGALLVQTAVILAGALLLVLGAPLPDRAPRFETLSEAPARELAAPDHARLRAVFAPATTLTELQALLQPAGGQVIEGPSSAGVLTIDVPVDARDALLQRLRDDARVRFAEPIALESEIPQ